MSQPVMDNFNFKANILLNFATTAVAVFVAVVVALALNGTSKPSTADAATDTNNTNVRNVRSTYDQSGNECTDNSGRATDSNDSPAANFIPGAGAGVVSHAVGKAVRSGADHSTPDHMSGHTTYNKTVSSNHTSTNNNTTNTVGSYNTNNTSILSNNDTSVLSDIANDNTIVAPILNGSLNGNDVLSEIPVLSSNDDNTLNLGLLSQIL